MYVIKCKLVTKTIGSDKLSETKENILVNLGVAKDLTAVKKIFNTVDNDGALIIDDETHAHSKGYNDGGSITWAEYTAVEIKVIE